MGHQSDNMNDEEGLGILFVHGIGEQQKSDTLLRFAGALTSWLENWLGLVHVEDAWNNESRETSLLQAQSGIVRYTRAAVHHSSDATEPSHAFVSIGQSDEEPIRWLLAESHWADAVVPPSFGQLLHWTLLNYPRVASLHYGIQLRRYWKRLLSLDTHLVFALLIPAVLLTIVFAFVNTAIIMITLAALILISLGALLPSDRLRSFLAGLQGRLTRAAGDSMVFSFRPIQAAAIGTRICEHLTWLERRCRRVVIVAHSQGAAVVDEALRQRAQNSEQGSICGVITFGSGLAKLEMLRKMSILTNDWSFRIIAALAPIGMALLLLVLFVIPRGDGFWAQGMHWAYILLGFMMISNGMLIGAAEGALDPKEFEPEQRWGRSIPWIDIYATSDPVPNGPLLDETVDFIHSVPVHNKSSMLADHGTYWSNRDGFVARLGLLLLFLSGKPISTNDDRRVQRAWCRRRFRNRVLVISRLLITTAIAFVLIARPDLILAAGNLILTGLDRTEAWLPAWVSLATKWSWSPILAGVLSIVAVGFVSYGLALGLWTQWNNHDMRRLVWRRDYWPDGLLYLFGCFLLLILSTAAVLAANLYPTFTPTQFDYIRGRTWTDFGGGFTLMLIVAWFFGMVLAHRRSFDARLSRGSGCAILVAVGGIPLAAWLTVGPHHLASPVEIGILLVYSLLMTPVAYCLAYKLLPSIACAESLNDWRFDEAAPSLIPLALKL